VAAKRPGRSLLSPGSLIRPAGDSQARYVGHRPGTELHWQVDRHLWVQADYGIFCAGRFLKETQPGRNLLGPVGRLQVLRVGMKDERHKPQKRFIRQRTDPSDELIVCASSDHSDGPVGKRPVKYSVRGRSKAGWPESVDELIRGCILDAQERVLEFRFCNASTIPAPMPPAPPVTRRGHPEESI
jgi:hypothetical protein